MTESTRNCAAEDEMRCPTCNATQAWSDECRRCKCDLSLPRRFWRRSQIEYRRCLEQLRAGRPDRALRHARRYATIVGAARASRLLGVCHLLLGNWPAACTVSADTAPQDD